MNKLFFILALGVFMPAELCAQNYIDDNGAFVLAKAVKLGRGSAYSVAADAKINGSGAGGTINTDKTCDSHCADCNTSTGNCNSCAEGYYLKNGKCGSCPANATCSNGETFICKDYYYKSGDSCQAICSGVSCKSGYKTAAATDSCCCEKDNGCSALQVYNTTIKKCVDAVCPVGCLDSCINGCGSCESGRYLNYSNGYCPLCSSAIANCETCTSSALGPTCTACASGYSLSNGKCVAKTCPSNCATCSDGVCTKCSSGYYLSSGSCVSCPLNATCTGTSSFTCNSGYTKYNNTCRTDPCDGTSITPAWCQDGLTRVEGKGCCQSGYTSTTQCLQCAVLERVAVDCSDCNCGSGYTVVQNGTTCSCEWDGVTLPAKAATACLYL